MKQRLESLEEEVETVRKEATLVKRELNTQKKTTASHVERIDELEYLNKEIQNNYDNLLREKMQLNQQKNNQIRKLQAEI